jgi:hypothetical protein
MRASGGSTPLVIRNRGSAALRIRLLVAFPFAVLILLWPALARGQ